MSISYMRDYKAERLNIQYKFAHEPKHGELFTLRGQRFTTELVDGFLIMHVDQFSNSQKNICRIIKPEKTLARYDQANFPGANPIEEDKTKVFDEMNRFINFLKGDKDNDENR